MFIIYFTIGVLSVLVVLLTIVNIITMKTLSQLKSDFTIQTQIYDRRFDNLYNEKNEEVREIYRNMNDHISTLQREIIK